MPGHRRGDFFRVVQRAMNTDQIIRLGRILDGNPRTFGLKRLLETRSAYRSESSDAGVF